MLRASIDIGSNSTLLLIMDINSKEVIFEASTITALGKNLDKTKKLSDKSMFDTYFTLKEYVVKCAEYKISAGQIIATATEASRVATNSKSFYENVFNTLGLSVVLINAAGEAHYTAYGVCQMANVQSQNVVLLDVGGASSELIKLKIEPFEVVSSISLPVGSVRASDWLQDETYKEKIGQLFKQFNVSDYSLTNVICVAGTLTTVALLMAKASDYSDKIINDLTVSINDFQKFVEELTRKGKNSLEDFLFVGKRIDSIIGGSICSLDILNEIKPSLISFSSYGLRYGTLLSGEIDDKFRIQRN